MKPETIFVPLGLLALWTGCIVLGGGDGLGLRGAPGGAFVARVP